MARKFKLIPYVLCMAMLLSILSACSGPTPVATTVATTTKSAATTQGTTAAGTTAATTAGSKTEPGLEPYKTTVDVTTWRVLSSAVKYMPGDTIDSNVWYKSYKDKLNINLTNTWAVVNAGAGGAGDQKRNLAIATGDLPDIMIVDSVQFKQLADAGQIEDLTDAYNNYASTDIKEKCYNSKLTDALLSTTLKGRIMGIAYTNPTEQTFFQVWLRTDWLKKLNLAEPKSYADLIKIAQAFRDNDPDGNGVKDTYGFAMHSGLITGSFADMTGFFEMFHSYPNLWVRDSGNKLVNGSVQPATKTALAELQRLMKLGVLDPEFGVKKSADITRDITAGKFGIVSGVWYISQSGYLQENINADPKADWKPFMLFSADDKPVTYYGASPVVSTMYYVVRKGFKNPEALIKMANLYVDNRFGAVNGDPDTYYYTKDGIDVSQYAAVAIMPVRKNVDIYAGLKKYAVSNNINDVNKEGQTYLTQINAYRAGDRKFWYRERSFGIDGSYINNANILDNNLYMRWQFYGSPVNTEAKKGAILNDLTIQTFTKIINGASIDTFDTYVKDWLNLGGTDWTNEIQNWDATK
ncbi:MAG TPA: hypothetical protein VIL27_03535 [Clostridia bacterium]